MKIHFWGTRGSIAVPGRETVVYGGNTTCVEIVPKNGDLIIIDAGTGIRALGDALMKKERPVQALLLMTHIHWDHILGFPFFSPLYDPRTRLQVDGSPKAEMGLKTVFETRMRDGLFPVNFEHLESSTEFQDILLSGPREFGSVCIESKELQHPSGGMGFKITENGKSMVFLTDNELMDEAWEGRKPKDYVKFCRDADLLIHDSQYTPEEIKTRKWWGHSDYQSVINLAQEAEVKRLLLTHHEPGHTDEDMDEIMLRCRELSDQKGLKLELGAARDGTEIIV